MVRIEEICEKVRRNHPQADLNLLRRAYLFSAREHKGQKRASGESYLVHPLEVANILADMRLDAVSVSTGLLHDVVEDTLADTATIRDYFGEEVAHLVGGLTKIAHISSVSREDQQAEKEARIAIETARDRLKVRVSSVETRQDLDIQAKQFTLRNLEETENRKLRVLQTNIEDAKNTKIRASREAMEIQVGRIRMRIRVLAVLLPPLPVLLAGVAVFLRRLRREHAGARSMGRLRGAA